MNSNMPNADDLIASSKRFAVRALAAHKSEDFELVPLFAATSLEHITKACLLRRNPALLTPMGGKENLNTLLFLTGARVERPKKFITVGLKDAVYRLNEFIESEADQGAISKLIDLRDGNIHIAENDQVELSLLVAYILQIHACLGDLQILPENFWQEHFQLIEKILDQEQSKLGKIVGIKMEQSRIRFKAKMDNYSKEVQKSITEDVPFTGMGEEVCKCPVCESLGIAVGKHEVEYDYEPQGDRNGTIDEYISVTFHPSRFSCRNCGLKLESRGELVDAGLQLSWDSDADHTEVERFNYVWDQND